RAPPGRAAASAARSGQSDNAVCRDRPSVPPIKSAARSFPMLRAIARGSIVLTLIVPCAARPAHAQGRGGGQATPAARPPTIDEHTSGMQKLDGDRKSVV